MINYGLLANQGRREDNAQLGGQVAHISAEEADMLRRMGGASTTNPVTGLPEYYFSAGPAAAQTAGFGYGAGGVGPGPGASYSGPGSLASRMGDGNGTVTTNFNTGEQAALTPGTKSAPIAPEASKMFTKAGEAITGHPLTNVSMLASLVGLGLSTFGQALANTGGYTSEGSPGGQLVDTRYRDHPSGNFPGEPEPYVATPAPFPAVASTEPFTGTWWDNFYNFYGEDTALV